MNDERKISLYQSLALLLIGGLLGGIVEEVVDVGRERRENTQSFVTAFNGSYYGNHRDRLHAFYLDDETLGRVQGQLTRQEYSQWITETVFDDPDLSSSVFAISEFYRTLNTCVEEWRCRERSISTAFGPYAKSYYNVFFPVLRTADRDLGFPCMELATARVAKIETEAGESCLDDP